MEETLSQPMTETTDKTEEKIEAASVTPETVNVPEPTAPPPVTPVVPSGIHAMFDGESLIREYREKMVAEKQRVAAIESLGNGKFPDMEATAIAEGWTPEKFELAYLRKSRPEAPAIQTSKPIMNKMILEAIAMGATGFPVSWLESKYDEPVMEAAEKFRGIGLQEF